MHWVVIHVTVECAYRKSCFIKLHSIASIMQTGHTSTQNEDVCDICAWITDTLKSLMKFKT